MISRASQIPGVPTNDNLSRLGRVAFKRPSLPFVHPSLRRLLKRSLPMHKLNLMRAFSLAVIVLTVCSIAFAQETTGSIEGSVKDPTGALVPHVTLTITSAGAAAGDTTTTGTGSAFKRTVTTNEEGFFRILQVPPGTYDVVTTA